MVTSAPNCICAVGAASPFFFVEVDACTESCTAANNWLGLLCSWACIASLSQLLRAALSSHCICKACALLQCPVGHVADGSTPAGR